MKICFMNKIEKRILSICMAVCLVLSICMSFPAEANAAGGGAGIIGVVENSDGFTVMLDSANTDTAYFSIVDNSGEYKVICSNPYDSDNEEMEVDNLSGLSVSLDGGMTNVSIDTNLSLTEGLELGSEYAHITIGSGVTFKAATISGIGVIDNEGTIKISSFKRSDYSSIAFSNSGTIYADSVNIDMNNTFSNAGDIRVTSSFSKGNFDLGGTVVADEDTTISSSGGTFTLQVGTAKRTFTEAVSGRAIDIVRKDLSITLANLNNKYIGEEINFEDKVSLSDDDYDGTWYLEYKGPSDSDYSSDTPYYKGTWSVRAVAPQTDSYKEAVSSVKTFELDYLPLSEVTKVSSGEYLSKEGLSNGKYVKDSFVLKPASGFLVRINIGDREFEEALTITKEDLFPEDNGGNFYEDRAFTIADKNSGAETKEYEHYELVSGLKDLIFDEDEPVVEGIKIDGTAASISEGDTIRAEKVDITVSDINLDKIITPDNEYTRENGGVTASGSKYVGTATIEAEVGNPKTTYFMAYDMAGREISLGFTLKYPLITPTASVNVDDVYVGTEIEPVITTESDGKASATYQYKKSTDSEYTSEKPTAAGTYELIVNIPETDTYSESSCSTTFKIMKKVPTAEIKVPNTFSGQDYEPVLTTDSDGKSSAVIEYKKKDEADSKYSETKPTEAGDYEVRATIPETDNYEKAVAKSTFTINKKKTGENKVEVADTVIGTDYEPVLTTDSDGKDKAVFEYKKDGQSDDKYTTEKPTKAGKYVIRATIPATENYDKIVCTNTFRIKKKTPSILKVEIADVYAGQDYEPVLTTDSDGKDKASFVYKDKSESGNKYTDKKPTKPGKYTVMAVVPETDTYEAATCKADFKIKKTETPAKVTQDDVYAGTSYQPKVKTLSDGAKNATFEYKTKGASDNNYSTTRPITVGEYTVRATVPETDMFEAVSCTTDFKVVYLETPKQAYTLSGTKGKNDYYITDVYLKAPEGYSLAGSFMGTYMTLLGYNNNYDSVYLRRDGDGALTNAVAVTEKVKIDKDAPTFADVRSPLGEITGLGTMGSIYADEYVVRVSDEHLAGVTVNGLQMSSGDTSDDLLLEADNGTKFFQIKAEDEAGNESSFEITIMALWLKDRKIPIEKLLPLDELVEYYLESGNDYTVNDDPTVYKGGGSVYVNGSGNYTFSTH